MKRFVYLTTVIMEEFKSSIVILRLYRLYRHGSNGMLENLSKKINEINGRMRKLFLL